ncbi:GntR family transcriptional regulator [Rhizobium beringeri]
MDEGRGQSFHPIDLLLSSTYSESNQRYPRLINFRNDRLTRELFIGTFQLLKGITVSRTGTTLWHQVGEALEAEIETGMYPGGSRLPTEPDLAKRFNVSRNTVRRAMATLEEKGLVRIEQGRGTFVHERFLSFKISKRTRFSQNLRSQGLEPGHELLGSDIVPATEEIAAILHLRSNDAVIFMRSRMLAEGVVVSPERGLLPFSTLSLARGETSSTAHDDRSSRRIWRFGLHAPFYGHHRSTAY